MFGLTYIINNFAHKAGLRLVLVALLSLVSLFSYARVTNPRVHYTFDNAVLRSDYLENALNISAIDSAAAIVSADPSKTIEIISYSSPEGVYAYNFALATRRAEALRKYIISKYPALEGRVSVTSGGESWAQFRDFVESDPKLSDASRNTVLAIVDSSDDPDVKERKLNNTTVYKYLYSKYFRKLRYAELSLTVPADGTAAASAADTAAPVIPSEAKGSSEASDATGLKVFYRNRSTEIENDYHNNDRNLEAIRSLLDGLDPSEIESIDILGFISFDEASDVNETYALKRAESICDYIKSVYPELGDKINLRSEGLDWEDFRNVVENDPVLTDDSRNAILSIIDSDADASAKEAGLRNLPEWEHISEDLLPETRYAKVSVAKVTDTTATSINKEGEGSATGLKIFYRNRSTEIENDYHNNDRILEAIKSLLGGRNADEIESIDIQGFISFDEASDVNEAYALKRAESIRDYIKSVYPELGDKINFRSEGLAWEDLRKVVENDPVLTDDSRNAILSIIDSDADASAKEASLRNLPEWEHISEDLLPETRYAKVSIAYNVADSTSAVAPAADTTATVIPSEAKGSTAASDANEPKVFYRLRSTDIENDYHANAQALEAVRAILDGRDPEEIESIDIQGFTSLDGPVEVNERYARKRGEALRNYITTVYPDLEGKINFYSAGEAWEDFRKAVEADPVLTEESRSEILSIIVSNADPDVKEARIRKMPEWNHLFEDILPGTRFAKFSAKFKEKPAPPIPDAPVRSDIKVEDEQIAVNDTTLAVDEASVLALEQLEMPEIRRPIIAVSTNVAYDLLGVTDGFRWTPNICAELPIRSDWSTYIEYTFPWWVSKGNDRAWEILKWDIGSRKWLSRHNADDPMDILSGHFVGIDLGAGYYDIEPSHKGWQGEFQTVGVEYGYAWKLGSAWRLDAFIGAGWMGTHFRYYEGDSTDTHLIYQHHGKLMWFGPTKAGVSLKYIFNKIDRRAER